MYSIWYSQQFTNGISSHDFSDTGTKQPESCVFGQLINIASAIGKEMYTPDNLLY